MPFTVTRKGGVEGLRFEAYTRMLIRWEVDRTHTLRTPDPEGHGRWLHVWPDRAEAERFARELRTRSKDRAWYVHEVSADQVCAGALGPVEVSLTCQSDGCGYELHPFSSDLVQARFPAARQMVAVFIRVWREPDVEGTQGPLWGMVARILTGLTEEQLAELGGYRVIDPVSDQVFYQPPLSVESSTR